jgi:hypothetical protein
MKFRIASGRLLPDISYRLFVASCQNILESGRLLAPPDHKQLTINLGGNLPHPVLWHTTA